MKLNNQSYILKNGILVKDLFDIYSYEDIKNIEKSEKVFANDLRLSTTSHLIKTIHEGRMSQNDIRYIIRSQFIKYYIDYDAEVEFNGKIRKELFVDSSVITSKTIKDIIKRRNKILIKGNTYEIAAALDTQGGLPDPNLNMLIPKKIPYDIRIYLAIFNSNIFNFLLRLNANKREKKYYYYVRIPKLSITESLIPNEIDKDTANIITNNVNNLFYFYAIYKKIRNIYYEKCIKPYYEKQNTKNIEEKLKEQEIKESIRKKYFTLQQDINTIEKRLNMLVYQLYGIDKDTINLIENEFIYMKNHRVFNKKVISTIEKIIGG